MTERPCTGPNCQGHPHSPECRAEYARSLQSTRSEAMESKWQPIETAPKDKRGILGWFPGCKCTFSIVWHRYSKEEDTRCWHSFGGSGGFYGEQPTHWMPLPEPPGGDDEHR